MDEYIDRSAAKAVVEVLQRSLCPAGLWGRKYVDDADRERYDDLEEILDGIDAIPAVDIAPMRQTQFRDGECIMCSWFGDCMDVPYYQFCPGCGASVVLPRK